ncbi:DUF4238 domain-containing protein [Novosphingobium sp. FSW06-99]|uniref:DUF4238 domain-containing protein n=1 Tax=Novosphingobium sp. FSW06-99 TaxID=1739113 RepID=UPI0009E92F03|nr:DUF4238 domain-containing protein [Novosphingobium sp. FSW06-99]
MIVVKAGDVNARVRQKSRKHHFNPSFYTSAWVDECDGRVTAYTRPYDKVVAKRYHPQAIGYEEDLYTHYGVPDDISDYIEDQFFKPVDTSASLARDLLLNGDGASLGEKHRIAWARFVMSMHLRCPFGLREVSALANNTLQNLLSRPDAEYDAFRKAEDPSTLYQYMQRHEPHILDNFHKTILPGLIDHEGIGSHIINMRWHVVEVIKARHTLLTCDRPFLTSSGLKDAKCILTVPISPTKLFLATNVEQQAQTVLQMQHEELVRRVNRDVVARAVDIVIGNNDAQLRFVENHLRKKKQPPAPGPVGKGQPNCPE